MRRTVLALVLLAICQTAMPANAAYRITGDVGGKIGPYLERLVALRDSGERVIIDGPCLSACTMVLGVIPHDRICATPRARLGFHAAWLPDDDTGTPRVSRLGTQFLMDVYPPSVRRWINQRGGLTPRMKYPDARAMDTMVSPCR